MKAIILMANKHNTGALYFADKSIYEGQFKHNEISGKGTYRWNDGKFYTGQWMANKMHGYGVLEWNDGK